MGKRKEHLYINFPYRGWDGENLGSEWDVSGVWVITHSPHPYVVVGAGDRYSTSGEAGAVVMTVEETQKFINALNEALTRIGRMKVVNNG